MLNAYSRGITGGINRRLLFWGEPSSRLTNWGILAMEQIWAKSVLTSWSNPRFPGGGWTCPLSLPPFLPPSLVPSWTLYSLPRRGYGCSKASVTIAIRFDSSSIQYVHSSSIRFDSIRFDSIRFDSICAFEIDSRLIRFNSRFLWCY